MFFSYYLDHENDKNMLSHNNIKKDVNYIN